MQYAFAQKHSNEWNENPYDSQKWREKITQIWTKISFWMWFLLLWLCLAMYGYWSTYSGTDTSESFFSYNFIFSFNALFCPKLSLVLWLAPRKTRKNSAHLLPHFFVRLYTKIEKKKYFSRFEWYCVAANICKTILFRCYFTYVPSLYLLDASCCLLFVIYFIYLSENAILFLFSVCIFQCCSPVRVRARATILYDYIYYWLWYLLFAASCYPVLRLRWYERNSAGRQADDDKTAGEHNDK